MEIKIKDKDKLIDATLEVVDGVIVVSPKDPPGFKELAKVKP